MRSPLEDTRSALVAEVDSLLDAADPDLAPLDQLALLGDHRLLAVHYPARYGGRGLTLAHHAAVAERMGERGLPDVAHLITVQGVGCTILSHGTEAQRAAWLPGIAAGRRLISLLLSEADAGSDLAGIQSAAKPDDAAGDGHWLISGVKNWSLFTPWSTAALCSVRTRPRENRYDGVSLFLVDLRAPGVDVSPAYRANGEPYYTVTFDDVPVGQDMLLGTLHRGWAILPTAIGYERMGFDYLTRAAGWLAVVEQRVRQLPADLRSAFAAEMARLRFDVAGARALAYHAVGTAEGPYGLDMDEIAVAYAKLACGRAAQAVARWAGMELLPILEAEAGRDPAGHTADGSADGAAEVLRAAVAEAPEFTISGGAQELQLDLIANEFPIGGLFR